MNYLANDLDHDLIRRAVSNATGLRCPDARIEQPSQGVNNQTYILREANLVVKVRPPASDEVFEGPCPHWPAYTCDLFSTNPNGDLDTLPGVTAILEQCGSLPVPHVVAFDDSCRLLPGPYLVNRLLPGRSFEWDGFVMSPEGARQLGEHLGKMHAATARSEGFGIFAGEPIPAELWWHCFATSFRSLADEVCAESIRLCAVRRHLERVLEIAIKSPPPDRFPLICVDQCPSHYLGDEDGSIVGFVDVEGHLWAPAELELSAVLTWTWHERAFRDSYRRFSPWPATLGKVRPAYACYTYLEWIYCQQTMTGDSSQASHVEEAILRVLKVRESAATLG